jgi:PAS domain S-box-containing protein
MEDHLDTAEPEPVEGAGSRGGGLGSTVGRYRALLDATPDLIFHLDREGRFLDFVSPKGQQLAIAPSEFLGRTVSELLPEDLARQTTRHIEQALQTGETQVFQCRFPVPLPDGNPRDYDLHRAKVRTRLSPLRVTSPQADGRSSARRQIPSGLETGPRRVLPYEHERRLTEINPSAKWWDGPGGSLGLQ